MASSYESIHHNPIFPAKIFVTQVGKCDFHWHMDLEILLVLKGSVTVFCGSEPTVLQNGDFFLFNSKQIHGLQRSSVDNLCLCIQFAPQLLDANPVDPQFTHYFYLNSTSQVDKPQCEYRDISKHMAQIALANQSSVESAGLRTYGLLLNFLAFLLDNVQYDMRRMPQNQPDTQNDIYNRIITFIDDNLRSETLSEDLCRYVGMSDRTLYRYLKTTVGVTLKELLDIIRIEKARLLLRDSKKPLSMIWEVCGFNSEVSFYRNFKKQVGITPNDYRKGQAEESTPNKDVYLNFNLSEATQLLYTFLDDKL